MNRLTGAISHQVGMHASRYLVIGLTATGKRMVGKRLFPSCPVAVHVTVPSVNWLPVTRYAAAKA